ncbi:flavin-containing monooxygenase [Paraconexibacter sp.]|uniref:flavin-containing monooxygenase n=1 Tax=Paraconexibacter sp. TaxID=2949640 RepID=UPI0035671ECD
MREEEERPTSVAIVGAGVSGLAAGLAMQAAGFPFTIFEKGTEVGGTWRDNRYPGLTIDVPSPIYTYREHRHPGWRRWMPDGPEILEYHRQVSSRTGLREHIRFETEITAADWRDDHWLLRTAQGDEHRCRAVVFASGFLHHPYTPDLPGLEEFDGEVVHSARWRDDIAVQARRVGVIGSGSTGTQLVGALGGVASHLTQFQRTPQWIFPSVNFGVPRAVRSVLARRPGSIDAMTDRIERLADWLLGGAATSPGRRRDLFDLVARLHLRTVRDPELRARLTPTEQPLCRRPVLSTRYYRAVQRPDVSVVDTRIERVTRDGIVTADGTLHRLDVLILATGFRAHEYMRPIAITGEDGLTLEQAWADGPHGYRTVALTGFPNLFMVLGPHSPLVSISIHGSAQLQSDYIVQLLDVLERPEVNCLSPSPEATARWLDHVRAGMADTVWATGCSSWYVGTGSVPVLWPYDRRAWQKLLRTPDLRDYTVQPAVPSPTGPST